MRNVDIALFFGVLITLLYAVWASQVFWNAPRPHTSAVAELSDFGPPPKFDDIELVSLAEGIARRGTMFSISHRGHWVTAKSNIRGCANPAIEISKRHYLPVELVGASAKENLAILKSEPIADGLRLGKADTYQHRMLGFIIGYPKTQAGEIALRLLSPVYRTKAKPKQNLLPVISWAETGRTYGLRGDLRGVNGSPVISAQGEIVGITISHNRRRGRFYSTGLVGLEALMAEHSISPRGEATKPISLSNYWDMADAIRRTYQISPLVCLP